MTGIYKITNPNGKVYIGQSVDIERRFHIHKSRYNTDEVPLLYRSFRKYGVERHIFEVLEECDEGKLNKKERYYQERYNSIKEGLNCSYVRTDDKSGRLSDKVRKKMSKSHKGKKLSEETKIKLSNAHKGITRPHMILPKTEETKEKISKSKIGKKRKEFSQEWKDNISAGIKGRVLTTDHKRKIGDAHKGRQDMFGENNGMYGKHHSSKTKMKIGKAVRKAWSKKGENIIRHNSKPVTVNGISYVSILQASKKTGISEYKISKYYM